MAAHEHGSARWSRRQERRSGRATLTMSPISGARATSSRSRMAEHLRSSPPRSRVHARTPRTANEVGALVRTSSTPKDATATPRTGATLEPTEMAAMFDDVAPTYDRLNTLMTLGSDVRWRRRAVEETR